MSERVGDGFVRASYRMPAVGLAAVLLVGRIELSIQGNDLRQEGVAWQSSYQRKVFK